MKNRRIEMNRKTIIVSLLLIISLFITGCDQNGTKKSGASVNANNNSSSQTSTQAGNDSSAIDSQNSSVTTQIDNKEEIIKNYSFNPTCYETNTAKEFSVSDDNKVNSFVYGKNSLGTFSINGTFAKETTYNGYKAYSTENEVKLTYDFDGSYLTDKKDDWNIKDSNYEKIDGYDLDHDVEKGAILVQSSKTGNSGDWKTIKKKTDVFKDGANKLVDFYTIDESKVREGNYYRVIVAYEMTRRTKDNTFKDDYENIAEIETYEFYLSYGKNAVRLIDLYTGEDISNNQTSQNGFIVDKGGTDFDVSIKKDSIHTENVDDMTSISEPGDYKIEITSKLNEKYNYNIKVTDGTEMLSVLPLLYEGGEKGKYTESGLVDGVASFGESCLTNLKLCQKYGSPIGCGDYDGVNAYGINGDSMSVFMSLKSPDDSNYKFFADDYGKKEKQKINNAWVGTVNTGALLIQKSVNGIDWENVEQGAYANGLYTTNYANYYANKGDVLVYTPNGQELLNGLYLKVSFAYNLQNKSNDKTNRCLEVYSLYLCSNNLDAVTFHNLSVTDTIKDMVGEDKNVDANVYKKAETLLSGSGTVTGFKIDTSLNPTVKYSVKRNDIEIEVPDEGEFKNTGKYDIELTSVIGDKKKVVLYVDTQSSEEALKKYFGDGFIKGKRIFSEDEYPVYEGGLSTYEISSLDSRYLPISGVIKNTNTNNEIQVKPSYYRQSGKLDEAGHYVATLSTRPKDNNTELPGDYRVFTFEFDIISEGSAPGPVVNKKNLTEYTKTNVSDSYPMYYGLTYQSASKGAITLAFASREEAQKYAYEYEKGMVEKQPDGSFRYNGSFTMEQKTKYSDIWDLTDAENYFAERAVHEGVFDLSDQFTYLTLSDKQINDNPNLRKMELNKSITIFADGEKEELCSKNTIPIISPKPYAYLSNENSDDVEKGYNDFEFVKDKYQCDSSSVLITDVNGKAYSINYNQGVGKQLHDGGCPSGKVVITEKNIYGDTTTYEAVYISENDNTAVVSLIYYDDKSEEKQTFSQKDDGTSLTVQAFRLKELYDELDEYSLVSIATPKGSSYYVAGQASSDAFTDNGEYTIKVINRLGYAYTLNITIKDSDYSSINFTGAGTDDTESIITTYGTENVVLPKLTRYGYDFIGYKDEDDTEYNESIDKILFKGSKSLETVWKAKQFELIIVDEDGKELERDTIVFGKEKELTIPKSKKNAQFLGWSYNGEKVGNSFTLNEESNVVLVASFDDTGSKHGKWIWFIPIIGILNGSALISFLIIRKMVKRSHPQ